MSPYVSFPSVLRFESLITNFTLQFGFLFFVFIFMSSQIVFGIKNKLALFTSKGFVLCHCVGNIYMALQVMFATVGSIAL